ncbi:MAG: VCBS repeat-containing protein [Alphaproteobacteria bacterium]
MALSIDLTGDLTGIGQRLGNILGNDLLYGGVTGGDVDGDGIDDLVALIPRGLGVILGGADVFDETLDGAAADITLGGATRNLLAVGDIDGDSNADTVFARDGDGLVIAFGGGPTVTLPDTAAYRDVTVTDLNGDGFADIVAVQYGAHVAVTFGGVDRSGLTPVPLVSSFGFSAGAGGDVNGDGYNDVILGAATPPGGDSVATVLLGAPAPTLPINLDVLGDGGFRIVGPYSYSTYSEIVGDVNGDGFDDIVTTRRNDPPELDSFLIFGSTSPVDLDTRALDGAGIGLGEVG